MLQGQLWTTFDRFVAHVVQDGRHEVLVHEKFDHRQIVAVAIDSCKQAVKDEACPSSLELVEGEDCIADQGNSPDY